MPNICHLLYHCRPYLHVAQPAFCDQVCQHLTNGSVQQFTVNCTSKLVSTFDKGSVGTPCYHGCTHVLLYDWGVIVWNILCIVEWMLFQSHFHLLQTIISNICLKLNCSQTTCCACYQSNLIGNGIKNSQLSII